MGLRSLGDITDLTCNGWSLHHLTQVYSEINLSLQTATSFSFFILKSQIPPLLYSKRSLSIKHRHCIYSYCQLTTEDTLSLTSGTEVTQADHQVHLTVTLFWEFKSLSSYLYANCFNHWTILQSVNTGFVLLMKLLHIGLRCHPELSKLERMSALRADTNHNFEQKSMLNYQSENQNYIK